MKSIDKPTHYQICLQGKLDKRWLRSFEALDVTSSADDETVISGAFDQSALHGLFNRIRDLGLTLISVRRHENHTEPFRKRERG